MGPVPMYRLYRGKSTTVVSHDSAVSWCFVIYMSEQFCDFDIEIYAVL